LILLDTSGLLAALNPDEREHQAARTALAGEQPPLLLSPFVLAEVDYLLATRGGFERELAALREVGRGSYDLVPFAAAEIADAVPVIERYQDLEIGLADASIVVLAGRYGTNRVLTLDERHFRALRTPDGRAFTVLPADAE